MPRLKTKPIILFHADGTNDKSIISNPSVTLSSSKGIINKYCFSNFYQSHTLDTAKDFTISFWYYDTLDYNAEERKGYLYLNSNFSVSQRPGILFGYVYWGYSSFIANSRARTNFDADISNDRTHPCINKSWVHIEISKSGSNLLVFRNGELVYHNSISFTIWQAYKNIEFKSMDAYIFNELLVTQECLHTYNFSVPTDEYVWLNNNSLVFLIPDVYGLK